MPVVQPRNVLESLQWRSIAQVILANENKLALPADVWTILYTLAMSDADAFQDLFDRTQASPDLRHELLRERNEYCLLATELLEKVEKK